MNMNETPNSEASDTDKKKVVIATASLAGCFGCHMSFLDIDERLIDLVDIVQISRSPLVDFKEFHGRVDIGIIEGGACNSDNIHILKEFRKQCKILVSMGECAVMGGLPAMRNSIPVEECLREAYLDGPTVHNPEQIIPSDEELPLLLDKVYPLHEVVKVDHFLPGCPPSADLIWHALLALLKDEELELDIPYELLKYD